jgi:hypothetical protein
MIRRITLPLVLLAACKPADQVAIKVKDPVSVSLTAPVGYVKPGDKRLIWSRSPGISRYVVALFDSNEKALYIAASPDTEIVVPDSVPYNLDNNYRWHVTAYRDRDSTAWRSPVAVFRMEGGGRRMPPRPTD